MLGERIYAEDGSYWIIKLPDKATMTTSTKSFHSDPIVYPGRQNR